jgi:hypothetical protein
MAMRGHLLEGGNRLSNADIDEIRMAARSSGFDIAPYIIPMVIKKKGETE